ncbi:MAG: hypothetical protein J7K40_11705 [candidate division Zixibacteria bacterium]|nr:hypothetical protein [candidate division Zixibacteria bacterium]
MKKLMGIMIVLVAMIIVGCEENTSYVDPVPAAPTGLTSITADEAIYLAWYAVGELDIKTYAIYRNTNGPDNTFYFQNEVSSNYTSWIDNAVDNGETYYYAVTAIDEDGQESELSDYTYDTPRPEGANAVIYAYDENSYYDYTGFDLYAGERVPYDDYTNCDIYLSYYNNSFYIYVRHDDYYIQDFGYADGFDDVSYAPDDGWSDFNSVEAIDGHMYMLKLWHFDEWHYARIWITDFDNNPDAMEFYWAYQIDEDNRELKIRPDMQKHAGNDLDVN